jgi:hypothetical protein
MMIARPPDAIRSFQHQRVMWQHIPISGLGSCDSCSVDTEVNDPCALRIGVCTSSALSRVFRFARDHFYPVSRAFTSIQLALLFSVFPVKQ